MILRVLLVSAGIVLFSQRGAIADNAILVEDFLGRPVLLDSPAERVVCLIESALSGIYMLGGQDKVVAISANVYHGEVYTYYAAMDDRVAQKQLPAPGNWDFVNLENVVALRPDLVIIWANQQEAINALAGKGIAVYAVELATFDDIFKEIEDFGVLFGKEQRAEELIDYGRRALASLAAAASILSDKERPAVYFMWAQGVLETSGAPSTVNDLIEFAGGRNVAAHLPQEHLIINLEMILAWQPEVIVMWPNPRLTPEAVAVLPVWSSVPAATNKRIFALPSVFYCDLWTLKSLYAIRLMASWCHPDRFAFDQAEEQRALMVALYGPDIGRSIPVDG